MKSTLAIVMASALAFPAIALAGDNGKRWSRSEWKEEYRDGPCEVKRESKKGEFKREVKCKDGVGARWRGEWNREFRDGRCFVKQEAKRDEFKEEVKCETGR
ncbi:hypothetical protein HHL21_16860 [Massilia sp. RP-1-19]|uniref:Uncharacterized protein n=2 Tax=Massilia polaris TaxID=2728846 RepID=A0A848HRI8_9BURK|nr:hypothetical protein [Massilia polaris]